MASPPEVTIRNLNGKFAMNKSLSDNPDKLLALQGLSWLTRTAVSYATVVLTIKTYTDDSSVVHVDIVSVASGLSTTQENRTLDWKDRPHSDRIFGNVNGRSRLFTVSEEKSFEAVESYHSSDLEFLKGKHLKDGKTNSSFLDAESLQSYVRNSDDGYGWTAEQVWNFETINGKRYYTRRVVVRNRSGEKSERVRLVYDYQGEASKGGVEDDGDDALAYGEMRGD